MTAIQVLGFVMILSVSTGWWAERKVARWKRGDCIEFAARWADWWAPVAVFAGLLAALLAVTT